MIGILIRFEGSQGSGKTTIANMVQDFLRSKGLTTIHMEDSHTMSVVGELEKEKPSSEMQIKYEKGPMEHG